jgi:DNA-binding response OmpR family regulator
MPTKEHWPEIAIVDSAPLDYSELAAPAYELGVTLRSFQTGQEALRAADQFRPDLWMINVRLPDMSGFDVVEMLRSKSCARCFFCISDAYAADEEIHSRLLKAAAYLCKPVQREWITAWISRPGKGTPHTSARIERIGDRAGFTKDTSDLRQK